MLKINIILTGKYQKKTIEERKNLSERGAVLI